MRWSVGCNTVNYGNHYNEIQILTTGGTNVITPATIITPLTPPLTPIAGYSGQPMSKINDGDITNYYESSDSQSAIQVDLGSVVTNIRSIKFWNYWQDSRTYYNVQVMISTDGLQWQCVYGAVNTVQTSSGTEVVLSSLSPNLPYIIVPVSYTYDIQPSPTYPDASNNELIDGIIAGHFWFSTDNQDYWRPWVGWGSVSPTITFNFGQVVSISKVSIYCQGDRAGGIYLPASVTIAGTTFTVGDLGINGWQHFSGLWSGSTLAIKLSYFSGWIFVSEVTFTVASINDFQGCTSLTAVNIPTSVTYIGPLTFARTGLTSLTIPSSIVSMGTSVVAGCNSLVSITAPSSLSLLSSLTGCQNAILNTSYTVPGMKQYTLQTLTSVSIPNGAVSISWGAYYSCPISSIVIPATVTMIADFAFRYSTLTSVTIPVNVTIIGTGAFYGNPFTCINNWNPTTVRTIGSSAIPSTTTCGIHIIIIIIMTTTLLLLHNLMLLTITNF